MVAVLAASVLFASGGASRALADFPGTGLSFGAWRVAIGAIGLLAYTRWRNGPRGLSILFRQPLMWLMGVAVLLYQSSFFIGAARIGIAIGTLVALGSAPLLAGLVSWWMGQDKPTIQWAVSTGLAIAGLALLTATTGKADLFGFFCVALAGWSYSLVTVIGVKMVREFGVTGGDVLAVAFTVGGLCATPILVTQGAWITEPKGFAAVMWAAIPAATVAYLLFGVGISHLKAGTVSTLTLFEPVTATALGVLFLDESITTRGWIGCAIIIGALGLLGYSESRTASNEIKNEIAFDA